MARAAQRAARGTVALLALIGSACGRRAEAPGRSSEASDAGAARPARGVVLMIGDGLGIATLTAARILRGQLDGARPPESARLFIDTLPHTALVHTWSADGQVTDSSSSMTAMVTGQKTNDGVVSMDAATDYADERKDGDGKSLRTILELAEAAGRSTGVVTTTRITHATPAACYAHSNGRHAEEAIALQLLENPALGDGIEVILGGGRQCFTPKRNAAGERVLDVEGERGERQDGRDLVAELAARGYTYVHDKTGFEAIDPARTARLLGLFEADHMEYELDRASDQGGEPSLAEMAGKAVEMLARDPDGFFLMVEGGRIDHALHEGQARRALHEALAFDAAVREVAARVDLESTLILVTADHDQTLVIAGYPPLGNDILGLSGDVDRNGVPYTTLLFGTGQGYRPGPRRAPTPEELASPDYCQEAAVPTRGGAHGGMDVALFAGGAPGHAARAHGSIDNTAVFTIMTGAMGIGSGER